MFIIHDDNSIELTRGDSCCIGLSLTTEDGSPYEPLGGDQIFLRLKKKAKDDSAILINKEGSIWDMTIQLEESDTAELEFGNYFYEIELVTEDNKHFTVIPATKFKIGEELESHDQS